MNGIQSLSAQTRFSGIVVRTDANQSGKEGTIEVYADPQTSLSPQKGCSREQTFDLGSGDLVVIQGDNTEIERIPLNETQRRELAVIEGRMSRLRNATTAEKPIWDDRLVPLLKDTQNVIVRFVARTLDQFNVDAGVFESSESRMGYCNPDGTVSIADWGQITGSRMYIYYTKG